MQKPGRLDLICYQGADFDFQITWTVSGSPVNLTGWTGRMQVRKIPGAPSATLSLTSGSGITLGGAAGTVLVAATATQTAAIIPGTYKYDLELVNGSHVTRLVQGDFTVIAEVTK
ncbi:MAG TPA: hypothetical protein DCM51_02850 [Actinobacteria bacterium]|nr:hypothetical protein [Actinomycetota bacterium]